MIQIKNPEEIEKYLKTSKDDFNNLSKELERKFDQNNKWLISAVVIALLVLAVSILGSMWIDSKNSSRPEWELINKLAEIKTEQALLKVNIENLNKKVENFESNYILPSK